MCVCVFVCVCVCVIPSKYVATEIAHQRYHVLCYL